jgi:hypothetical protein
MATSCLMNYFTKNGDDFEITEGGDLTFTIGDGREWDFYSNKSWIQFENGGVPTDYGDWSCDGEENYQIISEKTNRIYLSSKNQWDPYVNPNIPEQLDPAFSCVTNGLTSMDMSFQIKDNIYVVATLKSGTKWYFYQPKQGTKTWVEVNNKTITLQGTWSCVGETNFQLTRSDGKIYVGGDTSWKEATQAEPTYDKSKFPLKLDSRGPEVVQLQNYLNKLIPFEPLVVNGIFDKKTQDKLIQLQKNLPI